MTPAGEICTVKNVQSKIVSKLKITSAILYYKNISQLSTDVDIGIDSYVTSLM